MIFDFGFLILDLRQKKNPIEIWIRCLFSILLMIGCVGCGNIKLRAPLQMDTHSWRQYGGEKERTNIARDILSPPLTVAWTYDASAGYSEYSVSVVDSMVFIGSLEGKVFVVHVRTGEKVGKYDFNDPVIGTPVIDSAMMYVAVANTNESLYGFNLTKGKISWRASLGGIETSPLLIADRLYVATASGNVYCIDKYTGVALWKFVTPLFEKSAFLRSSPASDGNVLVFGCDDGSVFCIKAEDGTLLWRARTNKSITGSPSIHNGTVFIGSQDNNCYALDLATGKILWKQFLGSPIYSSLSVNTTRVYVGTSGGEMVCLSVLTGEILWRFKAQSVFSCAPLISGNVLYAGSLDRTLYALDATAGTVLWKYIAEARIKSMPVVWNEYLIVPLDNRMVIGLKSGVESK